MFVLLSIPCVLALASPPSVPLAEPLAAGLGPARSGVVQSRSSPTEGSVPGQEDAAKGDPDRRLPEEMRRALAAFDPNRDEFPLEAFSSPLLEELHGAALAVKQGASPDASLFGRLAQDFAGGPLVPERLGLVSGARSSAFEVRRPVTAGEGQNEEERWSGPAGLVSALQAFAGHLGDGGGWKAKVVGVQREADRLRLELRVEGVGRRGQQPLAVVAYWTSLWALAEAGEPIPTPEAMTRDEVRLVELRSRDFEETRGPAVGRLFVDATAAWLGEDETLRAALVPGLDHWRGRMDAAFGLPLLGHPAGLAVADANGDGLDDVYLAQPGGLPNRLLLGEQDGSVRDVSREAGLDLLEFTRSALWVDFDGDGDVDLVAGVLDELVFFENQSTGEEVRFEERFAVRGAQATSLAAADVDGDGDLDLYACAYASPYDGGALPRPYHDAENGERNSLYRNECGADGWRFVDATEALGLDVGNDRFSFACSFEDYDDDGDQDLYVANDFGRNNLYRNEGGRFEDVAAEAGVEDLAAGMGVSWGDANGDGRMDLLVSNMYSSAGSRLAYQRHFQGDALEEERAGFQRHARGNSLFLNAGDGTFRDASLSAGVTMGRWAWGAIFCDLDMDGREDLFVPNGLLTQALKDDL